jgi:hypothetical protein
MRLRIGLTLLLSIAVIPASARAQSAPGWHIMQDGVAFFTWNHQGGPRGGTDFGVQNWWMGMAERRAGGGKIRARSTRGPCAAGTGRTTNGRCRCRMGS